MFGCIAGSRHHGGVSVLPVRRLLHTSLWRLSGPAISFAGQWYAVNSQIDLEYQRKVFFVLVAQVVLSAVDYPYFIAARKRPRVSVPKLYVPLCAGSLAIAFALGWIDSVLKFSYCLSLLFLITFFARVYTSELDSTVRRTTLLGTIRNAAITSLLLLFVNHRANELAVLAGLLALAFSAVAWSRVGRAEGARANRVPVLPWRELMYCFFAAGLTSVFFLLDRYTFVELRPQHTLLVNRIFVCTSVVLLLSNIWAVNRSEEVISLGQGRGGSKTPFQIMLVLGGALVLVAIGWIPGLVAWCLLASPLAFAMVSPQLLAIQERQSARSTMVAYLVFIILKAAGFWLAETWSHAEWPLYLVPLLGVLCPILIIKISRVQIRNVL